MIYYFILFNNLFFYFILFLGNFTNIPAAGDATNKNFYIFDFGGPKISWVSLTAEKLGTSDAPNPKSPTSSPTPSTSKSPATSSNAKTSDQQSSNQSLIIGLSA